MEIIKLVPLLEKVRTNNRNAGKPFHEIDPRDYMIEIKRAMDEIGAKGYIYVGLVYDETFLNEGREEFSGLMFQKTDKSYSYDIQPDLIYTWYRQLPKGTTFTFESFKAKIEKEYQNICGTMHLPNISSQIFFILAIEGDKIDITGKTQTEDVGSVKGTESDVDGKSDSKRPFKKTSGK